MYDACFMSNAVVEYNGPCLEVTDSSVKQTVQTAYSWGLPDMQGLMLLFHSICALWEGKENTSPWCKVQFSWWG